MLPKLDFLATFLGLTFDVVVSQTTEFGEITAFVPFKVTDLGTNRKPVCNFLSDNNIKTYIIYRIISALLQIICQFLLLTDCYISL